MNKPKILCLMVYLIIFSITVIAHPNADSDAAKLLVHQWANAVTNDDASAMEGLLSEDFQGPGGWEPASRKDYLNFIKTASRNFNVNLDLAIYQPDDQKIFVSPVIITTFEGAIRLPKTLTLIKQADAWKISAITSIKKLSSPTIEKLSAKNLPEHFATAPVEISLLDAETGQPVFARIHISDKNGDYWPPRGHQKKFPTGWRKDVGGDVKIDEENYAYVPPNFTADLAPGNYQIKVKKGLEYLPTSASFTLSTGKNNNFNISIKRWANMADKGWFSGDTHTHFLNDYNALLEAQAEDLNVINVLATKWGELITNAQEVIGKPSSVSKPQNIVYFNEETRHGWLGHTTLHPIKELIYPLTWGGPNPGVQGGYDYPPMAH